MVERIVVVWPRRAGGGTWSEPERMSVVVSHLLGRPAGAVETVVAPPPAWQVLGRDGLAAVLWLPGGMVPTEACRSVTAAAHGIGVWTGLPGGGFARPAYSFGPLALAAYEHCVAGGCGPAATGLADAARHLALRHRVPVAGPRPGVTRWDHGAERARLLLAGKDLALRRLAPLLTTAQVDTGVSVTWAQWLRAPGTAVAAVEAAYPGLPVIVRSCAEGEDGWDRSQAGAFASIPVLAGTSFEEGFRAAAQQVFASYPVRDPGSRVLVQRWLHPVEAAAVVTTRTPDGAPYYTATVDASSGRTDTVTAGTTADLDTWYVLRAREVPGTVPGALARVPVPAALLLAATAEAEACAGTSYLDVEAAVSGGAVHLLQARPLAAASGSAEALVYRAVAAGRRRLEQLARREESRLAGSRGVLLSNMADWNPAEMIGRYPSPLAVSLYRYLITDQMWAVQRAACGYRDLRGLPLMHLIAGSPFIDVAASLASFLPASLSEPLAGAVLAAMTERLRADPGAHDKIEFEIAATCWTPAVAVRTGYLADAGIGTGARGRLHASLLALTREAISRLPADLARLDRIPMPGAPDADPRQLTVALTRALAAAELFAHLARAAFIATDLLRALQAGGLASEHQDWMRGLGTVTAVMHADAAAVTAGQLSWADFVARYRWLRPGTYDVAIPCYGDDPEAYLRPLLTRPLQPPRLVRPAPWRPGDAGAVSRAVAPLGVGAAALERFARRAITGRELGKAVYGAWVSAVLEAAAARGAGCGISRDGVRQLSVSEILDTDPRSWPARIGRRRAAAAGARAELPDVITSPADLECFRRGPGRPSFIGSGRAAGPVAPDPRPGQPPPPGAIIVVEAADPGFDWIFAHSPGGLITAYGGANSHMAIRCAELGIPAVIGAGTATVARCATAGMICLDAAAGRLDITP
jgi:phosphohistidine swiveling domain-containing protein